MTDLVEMGKRRVESLPDGRVAAITAARAASEKKAFDVRILEVGSMIFITDYFVIASGATERQVKTIVEEVERALNTIGLRVLRREGEHELRWVLLDFGDVVVHVFTNEDRQYYELERLWKGAADISWNDDVDISDVTTSRAGSKSSSNVAGSAAGRRRPTRG